MNGAFLFDAMGGIRPAYVDEAEKQTFAKPRWKKILPLAACLMLVVGLSAARMALVGLSFSDIPTLAEPGRSIASEWEQYAAKMAILSDPLLAWTAGGILLLLGIAIDRLAAAGKLRRIRFGIGKFLWVLGLQILLMLLCVRPWDLDRFENLFIRLGVGLAQGSRLMIPLIGFLWAYIYDLQKSNGKKASWGYPLGVAVFPFLYVLVTGGQVEEEVRFALFSAYYVPCLMISLISTIILKLQVKRKGD